MKRWYRILTTSIIVALLALVISPALVVYATDLPDDDPTIITKKCYRNILETADFLIVWEADIPYGTLPDDPVDDTYIWQFIEEAPWWGDSWGYRKQLTFDNSASTEDLDYFPVLVHLDDTNIDWTKVQNAGQDIRFVDSNDTTELDFEIDYWDDTNDAWIWVEVPRVNAGSTTDHIYMYYGNAGASDGQDVAGTWNSNYIAVYHMADDPDTSHIADSTGYNNDGNKKGANEPIVSISGIGYEQDFDGFDDYIEIPYSASMAIDYVTIEAYADYDVGTIGHLVHKNQGVQFYGDYSMMRDNATRELVTVRIGGVDGADFITSDTAKHYYAGAYDGDYIHGYVDGASEGSTDVVNGVLTKTVSSLWLGVRDRAGSGKASYLTGTIDEIRISKSVRSAEWIEATGLNIDESFVTFGSEEDKVVSDTVLGSTTGWPYQGLGYNYQCFSMYFDASEGLTWDPAIPYTLRLAGNPVAFATPPEYNYTITSSDYSNFTVTADVQDELALDILLIAADLDIEWGLSTSLVLDDETGQTLSTFGQAYFRGAIYGLQALAPSLFPLALTTIDLADRTWTDTYITSLENQWSGTWIETAKEGGALLFGTDFDLLSVILLVFGIIGIFVGNTMLTNDHWNATIDVAFFLIITAKLSFYGLGYLGLIVALCVIYLGMRLFKFPH